MVKNSQGETFIVHNSAGHGLNLQKGGFISVWYGLCWSLEYYQQLNKRLHRPGQENTVFIHHIIAEGTVDERVMEVLAEKDATQDRLIEATKYADS
jgi:SNF2 family DNA or RNA helicase